MANSKKRQVENSVQSKSNKRQRDDHEAIEDLTRDETIAQAQDMHEVDKTYASHTTGIHFDQARIDERMKSIQQQLAQSYGRAESFETQVLQQQKQLLAIIRTQKEAITAEQKKYNEAIWPLIVSTLAPISIEEERSRQNEQRSIRPSKVIAQSQEMFLYAESLAESITALLKIYKNLANRPKPVPRIAEAWGIIDNDSETAIRMIAAGNKKTQLEMQTRLKTKDQNGLKASLSEKEESDAQLFNAGAETGHPRTVKGAVEWNAFVTGLLDAVDNIENIATDA